MIFNGQKTFYNVIVNNRIMNKLPYRPLPNTTLNEKFNILPRYRENEDIGYPHVNVLTIGYDVKQPTEAYKIDLTNSNHTPLQASLFNHLPFYMREVNDVENFPIPNKFLLKTIVSFNNRDYVCCYGYEIDEIEYEDDILIFNNIEDDFVNVSKLDFNTDRFLNPVLNNEDFKDFSDVTFTTDFVRIKVFFSENELKEIINSYNVLTNKNISVDSNDEGFITEIGLATSSLIMIEDGSVVNNREAVRVQISYFLDSSFNLKKALIDKKLSFKLEVGGTEVFKT